MMNLVGWVPVRRGLLDHVRLGKLSTLELSIFLVLVLLADAGTGTGTINGPVLRHFLPDLSHQACKRALKSLEVKGYLTREIKPRSKLVYLYRIRKYEITRGPQKGTLTETPQTADFKGFIEGSSITLDPHPEPHGDHEGEPQGDHEGEPQGDHEGEPQGDHYYNNKQEKSNINKQHETKPLLLVRRSEHGESSSDSGNANGEQCGERGESSESGAHRELGIPMQPMRWDGSSGCWLDVRTEREINLTESDRRLTLLGVQRVGTDYIRDGAPMNFRTLRVLAKAERRGRA